MPKKIVLFFAVVVVGAVVFNVFLYRQVREICEAVGPFSQASGSLRQAAGELRQTVNELSGIGRQSAHGNPCTYRSSRRRHRERRGEPGHPTAD